MRRILFPSIARAIVLAVVVAATALAALPTRPAAAQPPPTASTCVPRPEAVAEPGVLAPGEVTRITLRAAFDGCGVISSELHIVLVLDGSGSMADLQVTVKAAAVALVDALMLPVTPGTQVGVVMFNDAAKVLCQLTNRRSQAVGCIQRVGAAGNTCIDCGIKAGLGVLNHGRADATARDRLREVMIVLSDGANNSGCGPMMGAAGQARGQGIQLFPICLGGGCDVACMRSIATSPRSFYEARQVGQVGSIFEAIRGQLAFGWLRRLVITATLGADMTLIEDTANPPAASVSPDLRTLRWDGSDVWLPSPVYRFDVRVPMATGTYPVLTTSTAAFTDVVRAGGAFAFPIPRVEVMLNPPTLTPGPATPTSDRPPLPTAIGPTATPAPPDPAACPRLAARIPKAAIDAALADPSRVGGWGVPCRVGQPLGPMNPPRRWLDLRNGNLPWHPVFNGVVFKCGCG